jgi:5-(carboxyamino)imidazole ribonucleotide synthase
VTRPILPGAKIGVLGSGQLGRMFAISARRMGYRVHVLSPDDDTPAGQVADLETRADYDDLDAVRAFAKGVSAVTFEFENVPSAAADAAAEFVPVRPKGSVLHTAQHRLREKTFLRDAGFPVAPFRRVASTEETAAAAKELGFPCVLKTAGFGYDGKGQAKLRHEGDAPRAFTNLGASEAVLEAFVDFEREISVVAARGVDGAFAPFAVAENVHENHVLDVSIAPADLPAETARRAIELARGVMEALDVVGVLCVECFLLRDGRTILVNELAPRPHNSGHLTFDACATSQFEQQLRAVCALPLGDPSPYRPAAMANLLGDLWSGGEPNWAAALAFPDVKLHLYGKKAARPGRKMGHLTATAATGREAAEKVRAARAALTTR